MRVLYAHRALILSCFCCAPRTGTSTGAIHSRAHTHSHRPCVMCRHAAQRRRTYWPYFIVRTTGTTIAPAAMAARVSVRERASRNGGTNRWTTTTMVVVVCRTNKRTTPHITLSLHSTPPLPPQPPRSPRAQLPGRLMRGWIMRAATNAVVSFRSLVLCVRGAKAADSYFEFDKIAWQRRDPRVVLGSSPPPPPSSYIVHARAGVFGPRALELELTDGVYNFTIIARPRPNSFAATSRTELALPRSMRRPAPAGRRACRACCDPQIYAACRLYTPHTHSLSCTHARRTNSACAYIELTTDARSLRTPGPGSPFYDHQHTARSVICPAAGLVVFFLRSCVCVLLCVRELLEHVQLRQEITPDIAHKPFFCVCYCMRCTLFLRPAQHIEYAVMAHCDRFESATIAHVFRLAYNEAASTC